MCNTRPTSVFPVYLFIFLYIYNFILFITPQSLPYMLPFTAETSKNKLVWHFALSDAPIREIWCSIIFLYLNFVFLVIINSKRILDIQAEAQVFYICIRHLIASLIDRSSFTFSCYFKRTKVSNVHFIDTVLKKWAAIIVFFIGPELNVN